MNRRVYGAAFLAIICQSTIAAASLFGLRHADYLSFALINQIVILGFVLVGVIIAYRSAFIRHVVKDARALFSKPRNIGLSLLSALAILGSDISFYYAITSSPPVEAYVIQEMWPILAALFGTIFLTHRWERLKRGKLALILMSFLGAALIVSQGSLTFQSEAALGYMAAFFCAICGAAFTIINPLLLDNFTGKNRFINSLVLHMFLRLLIVPVFAVWVFWQGEFRFELAALPFAIWTGMIVWGLGSTLWTYVYSAARDLSVSSLPYLITVGNVFFLYTLHDQPLSYMTLIAGSLILIANILVHANYRYFHTNVVFIASIFVIALFVIYTPSSEIVTAIDVTYLGTIFAIVASFVLNRLVNRNQRVSELFATISGEISSIIEDTRTLKSGRYIRENFDSILCLLVDYDFADTQVRRDDVLRNIFACETNIRRRLSTLTSKDHPKADDLSSRFQELSSNLSQWTTARSEYLSRAEVIVLTVLGFAASLSSIVGREGTLWSDGIAILIPAAFVFLFSTIRDHDQNRSNRSFISIMAQQRLLHRCGFESYMPRAYIESGQFPAPNISHKFRVDQESGETMVVRSIPQGMRLIPYAVMTFAIIVVFIALFDKYDYLQVGLQF